MGHVTVLLLFSLPLSQSDSVKDAISTAYNVQVTTTVILACLGSQPPIMVNAFAQEEVSLTLISNA